jgi:ribonuclease R
MEKRTEPQMMDEKLEKVLSLLRKNSGKDKEGLDFQEICRRLGLKSSDAAPLLRGLAQALEDGNAAYNKGRFVASAGSGNKKEKTFVDESGDLDRICRKHSLPEAFSKKTLQSAEDCLAREAEAVRKRPLVREWTITIDSDDAKDLDDAISIKRAGANLELGVHIADVSYYVRKGCHLDKEAYARGTSVYLNRYVIPMFTHALSNDLCSLNADRPKLAFSIFMTFDREGAVRNVRFERTVIQVSRRFSYTEVNTILRGKKDPDAAKLRDLRDLARLIRKRRQARGSLEFEFPELRIELDEKGAPLGVSLPSRGEAEMLIEDFMVIANEEVATWLDSKGCSLFRIHPSPNDEKLEEFAKYAASAGVSISLPKEKNPRSMQNMLKKIHGHEQEGILNTLFLRSLQKAVYSVENQGHFGLACTHYTHFTSPIRRYPDLIVHRLLAAALTGEKAYTQKELNKIAEQTSLAEQRATEAEREYSRVKGARFLAGKTGEIFEGKIASLTSFGMFVSLSPYGIDGLLHISALKDDFYRLDEAGYTITGARNKRSFALGDMISVRLKGVDIDKGFIDLELVESGQPRSAQGGQQRSTKSGQPRSTKGGEWTPRGSKKGAKHARQGRAGKRVSEAEADKKEKKRQVQSERTDRERARRTERRQVSERKGRAKRDS